MKNNALSPINENKQLNYSQEIHIQNTSIDPNVQTIPPKNLTNFLKTVVLPEAEKTQKVPATKNQKISISDKPGL